MRCFHPMAVVGLLLALLPLAAVAEEPPAPEIPASLVARLEEDLAALDEIESTTETRMACKRIVRRAESLIERHPDASDRFRLLGIIFETQKVMFVMRQSEENREALLATAKSLAEAPDVYAEVRVEPDMMLVQLKGDAEDRSSDEMALEIARFADRYRGTPAEARSLMMAASSAFDIGSVVLLTAFKNALATRFGDDPLVVAFMRERFAKGSQVHLGGEFTRADGTRISFPLGQIYLACFWSLETPLLKERIAEITAMQERYKGQFRVFSFNLDELGDAGTAALERMGLDWVAMRLPGGVENPTYLSVGGANRYAALIVGAGGLASRAATGGRSHPLHNTFEYLARSPRRASLLRSLCIGDYLVADGMPQAAGGLPAETLAAIGACFPSPPMRYRLSMEEERANYERAEELSAAAVAAGAGAPGLWRLHNLRTVALLGIWRHSGEWQYLERAVASARAALAMKPPAGADVVPRFCLATKALMAEDADLEEVLGAFIEAVGGDDAPGAAHAAALMLALEAHSRSAYLAYREKLLGDHLEDPSAWRVSSFLLDRSCSSRLFEAALPGSDGTITPGRETRRRFGADWTALDGSAITLSGEHGDAMHAVVFMEPTDDRNAAALRKQVVDHLVRVAAGRPLEDLEVVGAFRCAEPEKVAALMKQNRWSFAAVGLDEGEWQRCARELGVFSADLRPNVYLLRPDGSIMLALSGVSSETERSETLTMRIDVALREHSLALAERALAAKDYATYAARLATSFPLKNRRRSRHEPAALASSSHGRKLIWAYMQAEDWPRALEAANANIALQRGSPDPRDTAKWCRTCHGYLYAFCLRIVLLRKMGATEQADAALASIDIPKCPHGKTIDALWDDVEAYAESRPEQPRFRYLRDPKRFLAEHERNMRSGRQNLYGFGIESDLMMRATIHEKLGDPAAARVDRREAAVRAWPFEVREYDPDLLHAASVERRRRARADLAAGEWEQALALVERNIEIHEGEALRCNSMCRICWAQVQSFGFRARTLEGLGRKKEAEASRAMAELCKCPPGRELESYKCFPINRMYGGGSGVNRLNFIDGVMNGKNCYANQQHRIYRIELAGDLVIRAEALDRLGETERAAADRRRATALAFPLGARAAAAADEGPVRYIDLLVTDEE